MEIGNIANYAIKIAELLSDDRLEHLIFVDGDQFPPRYLRRINWIYQNGAFHVIVAVVKGTKVPVENLHMPWITYIETQSNLRDAADIALTGAIFLAIGGMFERRIPICIVTDDHFSAPLQKEVEALEIVFDIINIRHATLDLYLISELPYNRLSFSARDVKILLRQPIIDIEKIANLCDLSVSQVINEIERYRETGREIGAYQLRAPTPNSPKTEFRIGAYETLDEIKSFLESRGEIALGEIGHYFKLSPELRDVFAVGSWIQLFDEPKVLMYLSAESVKITPSMWALRVVDNGNYGIFTHKNVNDLTDDELIWIWKRYWKRNQIDIFLEGSDFNVGIFRRWLAKTLSPCGTCSQLVRNWIVARNIDY